MTITCNCTICKKNAEFLGRDSLSFKYTPTDVQIETDRVLTFDTAKQRHGWVSMVFDPSVPMDSRLPGLGIVKI